jgi:broad-specificity NMP kinase
MKIQIIGLAGEGKSTIARSIEKHLNNMGFNVEMKHDKDYQTIDEKRYVIDKTMKDRVNGLVEKHKDTLIEIEEIQANKDPRPRIRIAP